MRLLVLVVDRDDDLGRKTPLRGPVVGREALVDAAQALALSDPEESDANAMFAAVHEYDKIARDLGAYDAEAVDVALITGHQRVGSKSDTLLAHQFDEVLEQTRSDAIILVSDGAEDESIMPILGSRVRINGVRRVVIKQAKNLEGFVYLMARLMNDEKLQHRFFIPLAILLVAAGVSVLFEQPGLFISAALILVAAIILIQVFKWQEPIEQFFSGLMKEARAGKVALLAALVSLSLVLVGGWRTLERMPSQEWDTQTEYAVLFGDAIFLWVAGAILVTLVGRAMDQRIRSGAVPPRYWQAIIFFLAAAVLVDLLLDLAVQWTKDELNLRTVEGGSIDLNLLTRALFSGFLFFSGLIAIRYFHGIEAQQQSRLE
jgi:putative membrane protein